MTSSLATSANRVTRTERYKNGTAKQNSKEEQRGGTNRRRKKGRGDANDGWSASPPTNVGLVHRKARRQASIDAFLFQSVSLELLLLSIEQSLRLLLLLHYSMIPNNTNHNPRVLYVAMQRKSGGTIGIRPKAELDSISGRNHSEKTGCNHRYKRPAVQAVRGPRGDCGHRVNLHGRAQSATAEAGSAWLGEM